MKPKLLAWLAGIVILSAPSRLWASKPMDEIRVVVNQALGIVKESNLESKHERRQLVGRLEKIIDPLFDFKDMAKRSLGLHWKTLTKEERQEFVPLFRDFLGKVYLGRVRSYDGEKVLFIGETLGKNHAEVDTQVVDEKRNQLPVVYMLKRGDGDWKIYDVLIDHVSLVDNYRSQFDRVISRSSYKDLVQQMKQKVGAS
jgi:phospholipid transport system substrate-binding protein